MALYNENATGDHIAEQSDADSINVVKDGNYFLKVLKEEQNRLLRMAETAEKDIHMLNNRSNIAEDIFGLLRLAAGTARQLATQKMKQFEGLCYKNLQPSPEANEFPTTNDDLQGFWDMVYLQVINIDSTFNEVAQLRNNGWKAPHTTSLSLKSGQIRKKTTAKVGRAQNTSTKAPTNSETAMKREAQRQKLLEIKRQRRDALVAATLNKKSPS